MESFDVVSKAVARATKQAKMPSPDLAGSDGDGWIWRWQLPRQAADQYRGDLTLVFKVDAFGERLLPQLVASACLPKTSDAWTQSYPLAHLLLRDIRGDNVDALEFERALGTQLRAASRSEPFLLR